jgi:hypothetical protein
MEATSETLNRNDGCAAQMSVVLVTPDRYDNVRKTMEYLRAQTVANQLEIVIVAPSAATLNFDAADLTAFGRVRYNPKHQWEGVGQYETPPLPL